MSKINNTAEGLNFYNDEHKSTAPVLGETLMNLKTAISYFSDVEEQCDRAIQAQDDLIRRVTRRMPEKTARTDQSETYVPLTLTPALRPDLKASEMPFEEFHEVAGLANKVLQKQMPMATKRFMSQAGRLEIDQIEQLEAGISSLRQLMRDVELQILNHTPQSADEVAMKLKFMAALMLDGGEIEVDFFAYLVEESAEILEVVLGRIKMG